MKRALLFALAFVPLSALAAPIDDRAGSERLGREVGVEQRLADGEESVRPVSELIRIGGDLFSAVWTVQEGAGRPFTKGNGAALSDAATPLVFPRNFNRLSGPDANSCSGCHNVPFGEPGGGGDVATSVFALAQRFDRLDFDPVNTRSVESSHDERGRAISLDEVANERATTGLYGAGYVEMLARQMTRELREIRDSIPPGGSRRLVTKGVDFGVLQRIVDGRWDTSGVQGLPVHSLSTFGADDPPSLTVRPFHQSSTIPSLREFTLNALNQHHGIQSPELFGDGTDPDGDGFVDEISRAEVTALTLFQAALPVPGRRIPRDPRIETAVLEGERLFRQIGCARCHIPALPLTGDGHLFVEPGGFSDDPDSLVHTSERSVVVDLNDRSLPGPRLHEENGITWVPLYSDLRVHDITDGPDDPNRESLNMHFPPGSPGFFSGNGQFLTKRLWGCANEPPYFHHGKFTTLRQAILAHGGEAREARARFLTLEEGGRDRVIEFLKTLQKLPPGTRSRTVDENGEPRPWPPAGDRRGLHDSYTVGGEERRSSTNDSTGDQG